MDCKCAGAVAGGAAALCRRGDVADDRSGEDLPPDAGRGAEAEARGDLQRDVAGPGRCRGGGRRGHGHREHDFGRGADDHEPPRGLQRHLRPFDRGAQLPGDGLLGPHPFGGDSGSGQDGFVSAADRGCDGRGRGDQGAVEERREMGPDVDASGLRGDRETLRRHDRLRGVVHGDVGRQELSDVLLRRLPRRSAGGGTSRVDRGLRRRLRQLGLAAAQGGFCPLPGLCRPRRTPGRLFDRERSAPPAPRAVDRHGRCSRR